MEKLTEKQKIELTSDILACLDELGLRDVVGGVIAILVIEKIKELQEYREKVKND